MESGKKQASERVAPILPQRTPAVKLAFSPNIVPTIRGPYLDSRIAFCALCQWPFPAHRSALLIFLMFSNAFGSFLVAMSPVGAAWRKVSLHPASPRATESPRELH